MSGKVSGHLRSNVVGYVALFIALGGVAWAATSLPRDSVKAKQIKKGAVRSEEVKDNALTGNDVNESTLTLPAETGQSILDKLKTVDGAGSGLSADSLDDLDSSNLYTKADSDDRFPVYDQNFSMVVAGGSATYVPFASWAQINLACSGGGTPVVSLTNQSGSNMRVYVDDGSADPTILGAPLPNNVTTSITMPAGNADHVSYLTRTSAGTAQFEIWDEDIAATTNCLFNTQAFGQATGLTPN